MDIWAIFYFAITFAMIFALLTMPHWALFLLAVTIGISITSIIKFPKAQKAVI